MERNTATAVLLVRCKAPCWGMLGLRSAAALPHLEGAPCESPATPCVVLPSPLVRLGAACAAGASCACGGHKLLAGLRIFPRFNAELPGATTVAQLDEAARAASFPPVMKGIMVAGRPASSSRITVDVTRGPDTPPRGPRSTPPTEGTVAPPDTLSVSMGELAVAYSMLDCSASTVAFRGEGSGEGATASRVLPELAYCSVGSLLCDPLACKESAGTAMVAALPDKLLMCRPAWMALPLPLVLTRAPVLALTRPLPLAPTSRRITRCASVYAPASDKLSVHPPSSECGDASAVSSAAMLLLQPVCLTPLVFVAVPAV